MQPTHLSDPATRWRTLSELSKAVAGYRTLEELFHDLAGRLHDLLNFTYLSVVLHDPAMDRMRVWQIEGATLPPYSERPGIRIEDSPSGRVWQTQQALMIRDTSERGDFPAIQGILARVNVRSFLSLPLTTVQRRLGALNFGNSLAGVYDDLDLELPLLVASHIAVAVDNALHADAAREFQRDLEQRNKDLLAERARLDEIVREIPGVVWEARGAPRSESFSLDFLNDAVHGILGYSSHELQINPRALLASIHQDDRRLVLGHLETCLAGINPGAILVRCFHRDGTLRWIEIRASAIRGVHDGAGGLRGVAMDVTSRVESEMERRRHEAQLIAERLQERARIATDLHDTLLQSAVGSSLRLQALATHIPSTQAGLRAELEDVLQALDGAIAEGRAAVQGLRSEDAEFDLATMLRRTAARLDREHQVEFILDTSGTQPLGQDYALAGVARIAAEAMTNAYRHAHANRIHVRLEFSAVATRVVIRDDGVGINARMAIVGRPGHLGILAMRERATRLGGSLTISGDKDGTVVELIAPFAGGVDRHP